MKRTEHEQSIANNQFDKLRDELLLRDLSNTENYDKAILTLSASSLGLSLTAVKFIVPVSTSSKVILLQFGWGLLVLSIICSLVAYLVSNKALDVQLNYARDYYKEGKEDVFSRKNNYTTLNKLLNIITGVSFSIALISITIFISINIEGENIMADKSDSGTKVQKSANVPSLEAVPTGTFVGNSANIPVMEQTPSQSTESGDTSSDTGNNSSDNK